MSTDSTTRCEYCGSADGSVATRQGRGVQTLCDACDAWITERMRTLDMVVPDTVALADDDRRTDPKDGRTLALDPDLDVTDALEYATGISYEAIGHLEAAGFETVGDLWQAERDDLTAVRHVGPADVDAIFETISTRPDADLDDDDGELL